MSDIENFLLEFKKSGESSTTIPETKIKIVKTMKCVKRMTLWCVENENKEFPSLNQLIKYLEKQKEKGNF